MLPGPLGDVHRLLLHLPGEQPGPHRLAAALDRGFRDAVTCLVWVETPSAVRLERGVARDGEALRPRLLAWRAQEEAMYAAERTRDHADVVVDGQTGTVRK